jgi:hypothetical protein
MNWVDYINMTLAAWLAASPWTFAYVRIGIRLENIGAALALLIIATCGRVRPMREEVVAGAGLACGMWIVAAPWIVGYGIPSPVAALNELWIGFLVMLFAGSRLRFSRQRYHANEC